MTQRLDPQPILASDVEREQSVARLRDAVVEGRLTLEEFSERVGRAQTARTNHDLSVLTIDLPSRTPVHNTSAPALYRVWFSRVERRGMWELPVRSGWRSIFGTIELDLRQASLPAAEIELDVYSLFGTVTILIPPGITVEIEGGGLFASQVIEPPSWTPPPGAPRVRIRASGPGGTIYVRSRPR